MANSWKAALSTILLAGSVAGCLDLGDALVVSYLRNVTPVRLLQSIASGLLGRSAFSGGAGTAVVGAILHFTIAISAAAVFYYASRRISFLRRRPIAAGLVLGTCVYCFMNFVVLPLSTIGFRTPSSMFLLINGILAILLFVGLPISLIVWQRDRTRATDLNTSTGRAKSLARGA